MKTFDERRKSVEEHMKRIKKRRIRTITVATSVTLLVTILAMVLFVPYNTAPPDVSMYAGSDYYSLIQQFNEATYTKPVHKNNFEALISSLSFAKGGEAMNGAPPGAIAGDFGRPDVGALPDDVGGNMTGETMMDPENGDQYQEVTDNQVSGVTESDIFKRSSKYIYYLRGNELSVYSIAKEESALVGSFTMTSVQFGEDADDEYSQFRLFECKEMYLSQDCTTITVIAQSFHKSIGTCTEVINLDVSDPQNIQQSNRIYATGSYLSSRMVNGQLLLMSKQRIDGDQVDFTDLSTFVPKVGAEGEMEFVDAADIQFPDTLSHYNYTVISAIDADTLEVNDTAAFLSYSEILYVSQDTIYATRTFTEKSEKDGTGHYMISTMTEITGIGYSDNQLQFLGTVVLDGSVKNQYSMDQHNGVLRVVTSTSSRSYRETEYDGKIGVWMGGTQRNANLYCIDLTDWSMAASVIGFAPSGEQAESVRFDGDMAYVCTALIVELSDPVYFFDLSDLENITWSDTGTIDGYSSSLIQLGDGYLLGIGYGDERQLKIEVYEEVGGKVVSVCAYELDADFSEEYKSYYIDRENDLIGLAVIAWGGETEYILLHFDGYDIDVLTTARCVGYLGNVRGTIIDGYLYVLSAIFDVEQVW